MCEELVLSLQNAENNRLVGQTLKKHGRKITESRQLTGRGASFLHHCHNRNAMYS